MSWKTILLLPCLVSAYLPLPKKTVEQPVKTPSSGVSGSYGSIVGVQAGEINYGLVNSNLPAPTMNYGSIKQPQAAAPTPVEAPVSQKAGQVSLNYGSIKQQPAAAPTPVEAPVSQEVGQVSLNYGSIKQQPAAQAPLEAPVSEGASAYNSIKEASSAAPPPPTPKASKVPAPPMPQSYDAYASTGEHQSAVQPAQPPPPSNYGSINAPEVAYGKVTAQTHAPTVAVAEQQTQAPPVAGYGAPPVQQGYGALPPTSAQQKPVAPEAAAGSGTYETREIPEAKPAVPLAPSGQYGGYMSLSMWKSKSKDDTVPKEQQAGVEETPVVPENEGAVTDEDQIDDEVTPSMQEQQEQEQATTPQDTQEDNADDQVDENQVVTAAPAPAPAPKACVDKNDYCDYWKTTGECEKNPAYMNANCPKACGLCKA